MEKIKFEDGQLVRPAYVTIDNVEHEVTPAVYEGNTPLSSHNLNKMQREILEDGIIVSPTEPQTDRRKVWFQKGKNLFNKEDILKGYYINASGIAQAETTTFCSNYIEVDGGKTIVKTRTNWNSIGLYDKNKTFISRSTTSETGQLVLPENCKYIRISDLLENLDIVQVEYGTEATEYEAYVNNDIYVKNKDGIYEEFIKKEEKAVATVGLSENQTCTISTAWEKVKIKFDDINCSKGKFSLQNNEIVIGKGIFKILISANVSITENISGTTQLVIRKNGVVAGKLGYGRKDETTYCDTVVLPNVVDVTEGDKISLTITATSPNSNKTIRADSTYLTIQEV